MQKSRLEAFSDGVIAIIITIMVLELKIPHGHHFADLVPLFPVFISYILSFVFVGIYWNNHHHMFHVVKKISGGVMWANMHLLFWLSLIPFVTAWMGENHFSAFPVSLYGVVLLMAAIAYYILVRALLVHHDADSELAIALGNDSKGKISLVIYAIAVPISFYQAWIAFVLYTTVAIMWLVPDRRIERVMK